MPWHMSEVDMETIRRRIEHQDKNGKLLEQISKQLISKKGISHSAPTTENCDWGLSHWTSWSFN